MEWLQETEDPRNRGHMMFENTMIILASDNGSDVRKTGLPPMDILQGIKTPNSKVDTDFEKGSFTPVGLYDFDNNIEETPGSNLLEETSYEPELDSLMKTHRLVITDK